MRLQSVAFLSILLSVASAHFHLEYPPPRGPFVADAEVNFCDGYANATTNRTEFPLDGGFIAWRGSHPHWTFGVIVAADENPTSFDNFTQAVDFFKGETPGNVCFPVDLSKTNVTGLQDGANVTLQMVYDAGDGKLFQCADITLKANLTIPSSVSCVNGTTTNTTSPPAPTSTSGASQAAVNMVSMAGLVGVVLAML
ncbi:hypothetical protein BXZ70DRAFT_937805 [Cristinia sonorae]|uniref:Copper acquisition factor BIM1-like domain-containing protein n=1 Tax=Cristinia sonorae TaxID=1940300 RepID=A0A8K0XPP5_9AGAR|nr:hypothetical protein BXZ70DRAFT_937805 [Cristinia sonorae]